MRIAFARDADGAGWRGVARGWISSIAVIGYVDCASRCAGTIGRFVDGFSSAIKMQVKENDVSRITESDGLRMGASEKTGPAPRRRASAV